MEPYLYERNNGKEFDETFPLFVKTDNIITNALTKIDEINENQKKIKINKNIY